MLRKSGIHFAAVLVALAALPRVAARAATAVPTSTDTASKADATPTPSGL